MSAIASRILHAVHELTADLAAPRPEGGRAQPLIEKLGVALPCDAAVLMRWRQGRLVVVAAYGLAPELIGRSFIPAHHPRLQAICNAQGLQRFPAGTPLPDPFDGDLAVDSERDLAVHACMGIRLAADNEALGVLTFDALAPEAFAKVDDANVVLLAALAAATLRTETLESALAESTERQELLNREFAREGASREADLVGKSAALLALRDDIRLVAATDLAVLIHGETGTGKELVARSVHTRSTRAHQLLVHVNCAALPETIAESELFGHIKGAFTGATTDRPGKFELADHGTLFLDEIGELPLGLQTKLLRAIQQGEIQRVGADRLIHVDVRLIAATNRDLAAEVEAGRFRRDLYHRLNVYPILVPPLRDHKEDLGVLAGHFLEQARSRLGLQHIGLHPAALQTLAAYDWPGNVRELEHLLTRASLRAARHATGRVLIRPEHLDLQAAPTFDDAPSGIPSALPAIGLRQATERYQRVLIQTALDGSGANWAEAARRLKTDRANLVRLARRLGVD